MQYNCLCSSLPCYWWQQTSHFICRSRSSVAPNGLQLPCKSSWLFKWIKSVYITLALLKLKYILGRMKSPQRREISVSIAYSPEHTRVNTDMPFIEGRRKPWNKVTHLLFFLLPRRSVLLWPSTLTKITNMPDNHSYIFLHGCPYKSIIQCKSVSSLFLLF